MKKLSIPSNIKKPIFFLLGAVITYNIVRVLKMYFDTVRANVNQSAIKHITGASAEDIKLCKDVICNYGAKQKENRFFYVRRD